MKILVQEGERAREICSESPPTFMRSRFNTRYYDAIVNRWITDSDKCHLCDKKAVDGVVEKDLEKIVIYPSCSREHSGAIRMERKN